MIDEDANRYFIVRCDKCMKSCGPPQSYRFDAVLQAIKAGWMIMSFSDGFWRYEDLCYICKEIDE